MKQVWCAIVMISMSMSSLGAHEQEYDERVVLFQTISARTLRNPQQQAPHFQHLLNHAPVETPVLFVHEHQTCYIPQCIIFAACGCLAGVCSLSTALACAAYLLL